MGLSEKDTNASASVDSRLTTARVVCLFHLYDAYRARLHVGAGERKDYCQQTSCVLHNVDDTI